MSIGFYFDVHVDSAIRDQLRRRGVDVLTAQDDDAGELPDDELLERSTLLGRMMFSQDIRFKSLAEEWLRQGKTFEGFAFGHQQGGSIGDYVRDLELIALASDPGDWTNRIEHLPY